jgi:CheY-like chemotaxis protein
MRVAARRLPEVHEATKSGKTFAKQERSRTMVPLSNILHVDDDPALTVLVAEHLHDRGYQVTSINDPLQVIPNLPRLQARIVLLDIDMPRLNGLELLEQIKAFDGGIQVVMLTGLVSMTSVLQSLRLGAEACCFKPLTDFEPLLEAIEACVRKAERWWAALEDLVRRRADDSEGARPVPERREWTGLPQTMTTATTPCPT